MFSTYTSTWQADKQSTWQVNKTNKTNETKQNKQNIQNKHLFQTYLLATLGRHVAILQCCRSPMFVTVLRTRLDQFQCCTNNESVVHLPCSDQNPSTILSAGRCCSFPWIPIAWKYDEVDVHRTKL